MAGTAEVPLQARFANALAAYARYVKKALWPVENAVFYPLEPMKLFSVPVIIAVFLVGVISFLAWRGLRRCPAFAVGWLWFLITLVPVIGIVTVGAQSMADRYTYIPFTGLFIMAAWGAWEWLPRWRQRPKVLAFASVAVLCALTILSRAQISYWKDSISLFERTLAVTQRNWLAEFNMGVYLAKEGKLNDAERHYRRALDIRPPYAEAHTNLGNLLLRQGRFDEAIFHLQEAYRLDKGGRRTAFNLANALMEDGQLLKALIFFEKAVQADPSHVPSRDNYGICLARLGRHREALEQFQASLVTGGGDEITHYHLAGSFVSLGQIDQAVVHLRKSLDINPAFLPARQALERLSRVR
ncbi:tetratricopeptide repeat protein [bacterium]|nr:tetratricopeptide repeat protein [bacterium]